MAAREASRGLRLQQRLNRTHSKELICPSLCPFLVRPPAARPLSNVFQPSSSFSSPLLFFYTHHLFLSLLLRGGPRPSKGFRRFAEMETSRMDVQPRLFPPLLPFVFLEGRRCNTRVKWKWSVIKGRGTGYLLRLATDQTVRF